MPEDSKPASCQHMRVKSAGREQGRQTFDVGNGVDDFSGVVRCCPTVAYQQSRHRRSCREGPTAQAPSAPASEARGNVVWSMSSA